MRPLLRALTLLWLAACTAPVGEAMPELELGTGSWRFEPIEDGQEVELVRGAQGAWHVWISVRVRGLPTERPRVLVTAVPEDGSREPQEVTFEAIMDPEDEEGYRAAVGFPHVLNDPACLVGERLVLTGYIGLPTGEDLVSERVLVPTGGAYPPPPCE